ncbi:MAG: hypothetical protein ACLSIF_02265 [Faecalimonas umbilicata]
MFQAIIKSEEVDNYDVVNACRRDIYASQRNYRFQRKSRAIGSGRYLPEKHYIGRAAVPSNLLGNKILAAGICVIVEKRYNGLLMGVQQAVANVSEKIAENLIGNNVVSEVVRSIGMLIRIGQEK